MKVFWFDLETSGLDPAAHGIISLAYIVEIDGEEKEKGELRSNCKNKDITSSALEINGFTREEISEFPCPRDMFKKLIKTLSRYIDRFDPDDKFTAGGYNVGFDLGFLRQLWLDCGDKYFGSYFSFGTIDPAQIVRFLAYFGYDFPTKLTLSSLAGSLDLKVKKAHDALADIRLTKDVVEVLGGYIRD
jgi:DNA polymerase-3 subunit epsilon